MTDEQISRVESLIVALRSGEYKQAVGSMSNDYCCLGVACHISGVGKFDDFRTFRVSNEDNSYSVLPDTIKKTLWILYQ